MNRRTPMYRYAFAMAACLTLGTATAQNLPVIDLDTFNDFAQENWVFLTFTINISAPSTTAVTGLVSVTETTVGDIFGQNRATGGRACRNGVDFVELLAKRFTIEPGSQQSETFSFRLCPDSVAELPESFSIHVHPESLRGAVCPTGLQNRRCGALVQIEDDDNAGSGDGSGLSIVNALVTEPTTGEATGEIRVEDRSSVDRGEVSIDFEIFADTASSRGQVPPPFIRIGGREVIHNPITCDQFLRGTTISNPSLTNPNPITTLRRDFVPASGTIVMAANTRSANIPVTICADGMQEPSERIRVEILNARTRSGAEVPISRGRGTMTIRSNAGTPPRVLPRPSR